MAFEATKNFKKKSAGGRFEATSNFGVDDTVISSRVNAISKDIESLYNDYYKDYTERSKYVLGVDSKYENMQAPGLKVSMQSYKDRAKKIKQSIEDNKAFLTPEGYLAALQNVNSIIDTDTTEDDKTFSDYFNSSAAAGGREKINKIVEERAAAQSALKKAGLNENSKYRDIEAALSDRTIDAGAAPDEMGQGRRYQGRKLTSEDKDYLSSLLLTEDKVSTMTDDEILRKIKDKGNPSYKQKIALGEIDRLTKRNEELVKLAEADGNVSSFNPYGDYAEEYANNQQRMEKLRNMIDNDYAGRDVAYYYTDDNGSAAAMSWENLYYERKVGNAYKAATDKGYGGYNSAAAAAYDEINFIEKVTDAMQWLSQNSTVSAEKKKPYLDIVKEYDEKYGTSYAKEDGIYGIETKNRINSEIKNSDALNKLKENFKSESGATYDAVKDYARLQRDKERAAKVQETVQTAVEGVNSVPVVGKALGGIASAISAVPFALVSGTDYIFNLMDSIGHSDYNSDSFRPINTYDDYVTNISSEIIGTQTEIYDKAMQEAGVSERARRFWTSTYSGFSSGINSLATVVGSCYAFGPAAGQVVASVILSGQAASSGLQEAVQNGSTTNEALAYGFASGVAEYLGEKISIGSLVDKFLESSFDVTSFKSFMKSFVKDKNLLKMLGQGAVEGSEEVVTEIMNRFSDAVINQDHSKFSNAILTYEAEGLSREEAKKKAFLDVLASAAEQAWGGFVGGIMGGTAAVIGGGVSAARNSVADIKNQTDIGKSIAGTDAGKNVLELAEKRGLDTSKASMEVPEGRGVGKLVSKVRNAVRNRNMGKLAQNVVEAELKAAKETAMPIVNNNESLAEMVAEIATGTADVSAISALSANGVLTEENVEKVFEALEAVQKRTETSEVRNMINDIVETKESSEGKDYNASSIYGIKREGGKTKYILEDGTEVDSGEFGLTSKDKTLFVNAVKGMTDAEANEMISAYRKYANGTDKGVFATTWGLYRSLGETGAAKNGERVAGYKSRIYFTQNAEVNNVLVTSAIEQGVKARAQSEMKRNIKARAERVIQERGRAKGEVRGEEHLGKNKSGAKNVARTLAKLGYDVEFLSEDAKLHGKRIGDTLINGAYDEKTNTIYLRADATYNATDVRGILGHTLAHEVTHSIKTWSEADYNVLTDYIRDALEADFDALVKEKMDKLGMSYAMASDEVIADGCEMLLRDSKALEKLAMENANLFVKVASKVREFVANLRKAQTDMYGGNEELHDAALKLREALKSLEEVQEVFDNALENSIRNMRNALAEAENAKTRENLDVLEKQAEKEGIKLSEEISERDAEYLKLAKDPKKNAAQLRKLVDDAAKAAGFAKRLYHGTKGFGSTQVDTGYSDDGISFFMSDDERVTSWYSGTDEKKPIGKNISENGANNYEFYANTDNMYEIDDYGAQWDNILDADALDSEDAINKAFPESEGFTWDENDGFLNVYRDDVFYGEYVWDDESDRYVPNLPGRDPLPSRADGFGAGTTRSLSRAIYDSGKYSGVIFRKIHDAGFDNGNTYADIYNFFYPESQVKSADLVTYDDNGNIIPLSERFNTEENDLRYSEETNFDNSSTQKKIYDIIKSGTEDEDGKSFDQRFRDIQKACREMSQRELQSYRERRSKLDERVRAGLRDVFQRRVRTGSAGNRNGNALRLISKSGEQFNIVEVDATTFHDVFEICRCFLENGELVDLHGIKTSSDGIGYEDMTNYITDDGMSGFAITKDGDIVSVYNLGTQRGFLSAIAPVVKERSSTLDCYMSPNQPLHKFYEKYLGFKIASVMDYNMEYDHDNIAKNHQNPQIAFMVNSDSDVQTRHFSKDDYDGAKSYQLEQASDVQFSEETETSRDTLVSDMEAVAETDEEKSFVEKLKSEVKKANALQKELAEVNRKIKEISFTKGADRSDLPSLNEKKERLAKKLSRLDSKFYGYRGYDTFKTLAERKSKEAVIAERLRGKEALRSQKQKYQEAAQGIKDTLAQREENRRRREIVRDIAKRIDKLDKLAKEDSKTKHIPSALRDIVKAFREQIDSRTQNYDERIARAENAIASLEKRRGRYLDAYTEYTQLAERIKQYDKGSKDYADADARMGQLKQDFDSYNSLTEQIEKKLSSIEKSGERNVRAADYLSEMLSYYKTYDNADSTYYIDVSDLARAIEDLRHSIGERPLYLLTADQLEDVLAVTKAVQKKISDANKLFRSSRSVSETTAKVAGEAKDARNKKVSRSDFVRGAKDRTANMLYWNNLKPYELFKQSGSDTLYQLYRNLQRAEGDSGRLILKYADKYRETAQKYGIKEKMFNQKFDITFDNGKTARLTGGEILTLYLTAKRGQGRVHLLGDGFRLEGGKMRLVADGKETVYANADMMTLTENDLTKFGKTLSDDMRRFGDEMQKYMSTEIAADGNAVSMKLYDIMLFGEDNYITLTVDNNYLRSTIDPKNNTAKLKNSKFTIKTVANATQALSISSFVNVYQTHASDMAAYAAFTLPLEDITKVINGTSKSEDGSTRVRDVLGSKLYGEMMKFLTDVNGGIRSDGDLAYMRLFSAVKAARTGLNLAVAIQQPCAVMRAFAEINPKYFIGVKAKTMSEAQQRKSLAEMTQYASTWVVKQLGGVDINTKQSIGKTITDLGAKGNTFGHTAAKGLQEGQFWVAEKLDQVTWMWIWNACRNEAIDNFKKSNADYTNKDVLKKAGDRFDEITNKTQVYDSIFARSKIMRDGKAFEKFITQFMAEPMTTLNMAYDGVRLLLNGEKGKAAGIFASLIVNGIFTAAIRSFADAFRDDDDDKNYWEKYLQAFIENSIDNINPFMLLPWFKDIYSLVFNGFNVDRPDVEIIGDLMTKVKKLAKVWGDESKNAKERAEASWDALSILADMSGVAMTSLTRDFRAIYRTITTEWQSATKTTTNTAADTAWKNGLSRNLTTPRDDKGKLYYAFMNDDDTYIARTQDRLGEKDFRRRVIDGLKDNDIRIAEAAAAHIDGDYEKYDSIIRDIANDGFDKEYVVAAVVSAENKALKDSADEDVDTVSQIDGMTATKKDIIADVEEGNYDLLEEYYRLKVDYYKEKEADDPEGKAFTSVRSLLSGHYRELYKDGDEDERERIADILGDVTVDGHKVIKKATVRKWKED